MQDRPKIILNLSQFDEVLEAAGYIIIIILWLSTFIIYSRLPDTIPTHFNAAGVPNDFGSKLTVILFPVLGTVIFWGLTMLNKYSHIFNFPVHITNENAAIQYANATRILRFLKLAIVIIFTLVVVLTYFAATGKITRLGNWVLPLIFSLIMFPTIYFAVKAFRKTKTAL